MLSDLPDTSGSSFELQGKAVHLTYRGHLSHEVVVHAINGRLDVTGNAVRAWSICWETGSQGTYDHTHCLLLFTKRLHTRDAHFFDIAPPEDGTGVVHPNIKRVTSKTHIDRIIDYHKKESVPDVSLWTEGLDPKKSREEVIARIESHSSKYSLSRDPELVDDLCKPGFHRWAMLVWDTRKRVGTLSDRVLPSGWQRHAFRLLWGGDTDAAFPPTESGVRRNDFEHRSRPLQTDSRRNGNVEHFRRLDDVWERPRRGGRDVDRGGIDAYGGEPDSPPRLHSAAEDASSGHSIGDEWLELDRTFVGWALHAKEPPNSSRRILWYWETEGCRGKSFFARFLRDAYHGVLLKAGKKEDVLHAIRKHLDSGGTPFFVFDFTRDAETLVNYNLLESLIDGEFLCSKYDSVSISLPQKCVICFSNWKPDTSKLSLDRWHVCDLNGEPMIS